MKKIRSYYSSVFYEKIIIQQFRLEDQEVFDLEILIKIRFHYIKREPYGANGFFALNNFLWCCVHWIGIYEPEIY